MRTPIRRRLAVWSLVAMVVGCVAWLGVRGAMARRELLKARASAAVVSELLRSGELDRAEASVASAEISARRARRLTNDIVWRTGALVPLLGRSVDVTRDISEAVDRLAGGVLPDLLASARQLEVATKDTPGSSIRLDNVRSALAPVQSAQQTARSARRAVGSGGRRWVIPALSSARDELAVEVDALTRELEILEPALRLAPAMLGEREPRTYFLAFETLAELRGSGGLIGAYGVLTADKGVLRLAKIGRLGDLTNPLTPAVDLGPEFQQRYGAFAAAGFWPNANVSPHFPYTDQIVRALWRRQFGVELAGTLAIDSIGLSELLRVAGPFSLKSGEVVDADNVVDLSLRDAYVRFPDEATQNAFSVELAEGAANKLLGGLDQPVKTLLALAKAAGAGHLRMAARDADEQRVLAGRSIGGVLPTEPGPFIGVALNNAGGTKLDYYLRGSVDYRLDRRTGLATAKVTLRNDVPLDRIPRIGGTSIGGRSPDDPPAPRGRNRLHVSLLGGVGAQLRGGSVDGVEFVQEKSLPGQPWILGSTRTLLDPGVERGHGVFSTFVDLDAGQEITLTIQFLEPLSAGPVRLWAPTVVTPFRTAIAS